MLRYVYGDELDRFPRLRDTMFRDRAAQFRQRLGWDVRIDRHGFERDAYDAMNPLYVVWQGADGRHGGSMRFLPTVGQTMASDHFRHLTGGGTIRHPLIWECTRFCVSENAGPGVSAALMLGAMEVGLGFHLTDAIGVFDARMVRIYRRLGWEPTVLGSDGAGPHAISVGLWHFAPSLRPRLLQRAGVSAAQSTAWFEQAFGPAEAELAQTG